LWNWFTGFTVNSNVFRTLISKVARSQKRPILRKKRSNKWNVFSLQLGFVIDGLICVVYLVFWDWTSITVHYNRFLVITNNQALCNQVTLYFSTLKKCQLKEVSGIYFLKRPADNLDRLKSFAQNIDWDAGLENYNVNLLNQKAWISQGNYKHKREWNQFHYYDWKSTHWQVKNNGKDFNWGNLS